MTSTTRSWREYLRLTNLTGPILDKELRVESRRRRTYWMRFVYVTVLAGLISLAWMQTRASRISVMQTASMALVGRSLVIVFLVFQFVAAQMMAVVSLSTAISDEIQHRTLGVLMTTPITGLQIVMGKLLSRLLHVLLLLALGLPVLAIVRVFGGIPWDYVLASLAVTATAAVFTGAVSLFFSIRSGLAYAVILRAAFAVGVFYVFVPLTVILTLRGAWAIIGGPRGMSMGGILPYLNPILALMEISRPNAAAVGKGAFCWPVHCLFMLAASGIVLFLTVRNVRRVALRQATGQLEAQATALEDKVIDTLLPESTATRHEGPLRSVHGPPVVWKELASPLIPGRKEKTTISLVAAVMVLALLYGINDRQRILNEDVVQVAYVELFMILGTLVTLLLVSTPITAEKEAGTWPILLSTPVTDLDILVGKAVGVMRRCTVVWAFLAGHLLLCVALGFIHWTSILHMAMLVAGVSAFVCGSGLYLGSRLRRTAPTVVVNLALVLSLWFILPAILNLGLVFGHWFWGTYVWLVNPFVQADSIIRGSCDLADGTELGQVRYGMPLGAHGLHFITMTSILLVVMAGNLLAGLGLGVLARRRLRREIF